MAEGTIVKVGCLGGDDEDGAGAAPAAAEQATGAPGTEQAVQQAGADLAAAAAAAPEVKQEAGLAALAADQAPPSAAPAQVGVARLHHLLGLDPAACMEAWVCAHLLCAFSAWILALTCIVGCAGGPCIAC